MGLFNRCRPKADDGVRLFACCYGMVQVIGIYI